MSIFTILITSLSVLTWACCGFSWTVSIGRKQEREVMRFDYLVGIDKSYGDEL